MSINFFKTRNSENGWFSKYAFWRGSDRFSVSLKLNVVIFLIIISGTLGIIGAYEIQLGGKMHELNYFHQKYVTEVIKSVKKFESNESSIDVVKNNILQIRHQPIQCIDLVGTVELFLMKLINTDTAIQVCKNDILTADNILQKIQDFKVEELDSTSLLIHLHESIHEFENNGTQFEPLIGRTVDITFLIVITVMIASAFVIPIFGLLLSRSVAHDYKILLETKFNLQEEKKRNSMIQAERMVSLTTMVAGIAHEVNTPVGVSISAISHSIDLFNKVKKSYEAEELTETELNEFFAESIKVNNIVSSNLLRTSTLIRSFKQVSVDQSVDDLQTINLKSYIEKVLLTLTPLTKNSGIEVKFICNDSLQANTHGGTLSQIITNLMTNAIKHAFENSKQGTISIYMSQTVNKEIFLSFTDNGCGISDVEQIHIFEPFFTTKRGSGGTGLGLHILHNLVVDKLKGRVSCSSKINEGTQFDIYFPIGVIS